MLRCLVICCLCACVKKNNLETKAPNIAEARAQGKIYHDLWDRKFIRKLSELPTKGQTDDIPYSGHWYPEKTGGTAPHNWNGESPLHKYDRAFHGQQGLAVKWEQTYHAGSNREDWAGHCNGFSGAAQRHREPQKAVTKNGVTFQPQDIKALLAEIHIHRNVKFLGGRRCENVIVANTVYTGYYGNQMRSCPAGYSMVELRDGHTSYPKCVANKRNRGISTVIDECEDVNAGTFHLIISNWIGKRRQTIIFDKEAFNQVWNYPLYGYKSRIEQLSKQQAIKRINPGLQSNIYPFNPQATKFYYVKTTLSYTDVHNNGEFVNKHNPASLVLEYVLEIDAFGDIIGGEWLGTSRNFHPDFLWISLEPKKSVTLEQLQRWYPNNPQKVFHEARSRSNPYIDPETVMSIWAESVGLDPKDRPPRINTGRGDDSWGSYPKFNLLLDGDSIGTVFLGKKIYLDVAFKDAPDNSIKVKLNDSLLDSPITTRNELNYHLNPRPGINILSITDDDDQRLVVFHALPP